MRLNPGQRRAVQAVRRSESRSFVDLARLAELDPASDFIGANLRGIDFGTDNLAGFNFARADLRNTNLVRARGLHSVTWDDANIDATTLGWPVPPPGFDLDVVVRMILAGETIPAAWCPFVITLDLAGTLVSDLSPLAGLAALQSLDLSRTRVSDVSPLAGVAALQRLDLISTQVSDVSPLAGVAALGSPPPRTRTAR